MLTNAQDMVRKLIIATIIGALIIVVALFALVDAAATVGEAHERGHLAIEALKDVGVVVIGIVVIELVWLVVGGAPTEQSLSRLLSQLSDASKDIRGDVDSVRNEVTMMSTLAASGRDCGLANIAANQDKLKYDYTDFIAAVTTAKQKIDICGAALDFLHASDDALLALSERAAQGLDVEILLPASENIVFMAIFQDRFESRIRQTAEALAGQIAQSAPNIKLRRIKTKALTMTMIRIDEQMLVTPYLFSRQTGESPRLLIHGSATPLFRVYEKEFRMLADS